MWYNKEPKMPNRHGNLDNIPEGEGSKYYSLPRLKRKETWRRKGVSHHVLDELVHEYVTYDRIKRNCPTMSIEN